MSEYTFNCDKHKIGHNDWECPACEIELDIKLNDLLKELLECMQSVDNALAQVKEDLASIRRDVTKLRY